jgi:hypothetical protein
MTDWLTAHPPCCRLYLEPDGLDIRARPEFVHVVKNGSELNALKFNLQVDRI